MAMSDLIDGPRQMGAPLIIARQRAAHQVLDHGSILHHPFAMKLLLQTKRKCFNLRTDTPWPASDVCSPPREAGLRKMLCQELSKGCRKSDSADRHPWRRTRHFRSPESPWRTTDPYL